MAEKQNDKRLDMRKITMAVNMLLLLCGLVYVMVVTISGYNGRLWYKLSLMILMMGYSLLFNIAALYAMNAFDNMTRQQGRSYFGYMIFDVVELCFLAMFVVNVGDFDEPFHYIALGVFLILTIPSTSLGFFSSKKRQRCSAPAGDRCLIPKIYGYFIYSSFCRHTAAQILMKFLLFSFQ